MNTTQVEKVKRRRCSRACESCKKRKVRCDAQQPCRACSSRKQECVVLGRFVAVDPPSPQAHGSRSPKQAAKRGPKAQQLASVRLSSPKPPHAPLSPLSFSKIPTQAIQDYAMPTKPFARLPLLQALYDIVHTKVGYCDFWNHLVSHELAQCPELEPLEAYPATSPPPRPSLPQARYLLHWYKIAVSPGLGFINLRELDQGLSRWLEIPSVRMDATTATYYLALAIGAQCCPGKKGKIAEGYLCYGRHIAMSTLWEAGISTIQSHLLLAIYLLTDLRPDSALLHLRVALEAAMSLEIHKQPLSPPPIQFGFESLESLWRAIQILDLSTAAVLDRPPMTSGIHGVPATKASGDPCDLYSIFAIALSETRNKHLSPSKAIEMVMAVRNSWIFQWTDLDGMRASKGSLSDLDYLHPKGTYYRVVLLLSQPFLLRVVRASQTGPRTPDYAVKQEEWKGYEEALMTLCLEAAVRMIHVLKAFISSERTPKRLPYLVNSVFLSALTLFLALFGNLNPHNLLQCSLQDAQLILHSLEDHDRLAAKYLRIVIGLQNANTTYISLKAFQGIEQVDSQYDRHVSDQGVGQLNSPLSVIEPEDVRSDLPTDKWEEWPNSAQDEINMACNSSNVYGHGVGLGGEGLGVLEWWQIA